MLREVMLFLKYNMLLSFGSTGRGKIRGLKGYVLSMFVMSFAFYTIFSNIFKDISNVTIDHVNPLKVSMLFWASFMNLMFLIGSIGGGIYVLSMSEELEFLLSLPIRRSSIAFYQMISVVVFQLPFGGLYLSAMMIYSKIILGNPVPGILAFLVHLPMIVSLGMLISVSFARGISRSIARRIFIGLQLVEVLPVFFITAMSDKGDVQAILNGLRRIEGALSNPINVTAYGVMGIENPVYVAFSFGILALSLIFFERISRNISFEVLRGTGKVKWKDTLKMRSRRRYALLRKDLKAFFRNEMTFFYLLYPYVFGIFMGWNAKNSVNAVAISLVLSLMYSYNEAISVSVPDVLYWDLSRSLPVPVRRLFMSKLLLPVVINTFLMCIVICVGWILWGFSYLGLVLLAISAFYYLMGSLMGIKTVLRNPPRSDNPSTTYKIGSFLDSLICMGLGSVTIIGVGALSSGKIWGWLLMIAGVLASAFVVYMCLKTIALNLSRLEEGS